MLKIDTNKLMQGVESKPQQPFELENNNFETALIKGEAIQLGSKRTVSVSGINT
jgi:hypothetical protein